MSSQAGRTFHNTTAPYPLPNDEPEHVRLEKQGTGLTRLMHGRIVHVPLIPSVISNVLDIGCGTGQVTKQLGRQYPRADVYGLDISDVPDRFGQKPPNVEFVKDDIFKLNIGADERFEPESFDFCWSRLMMSGIPDWPHYFGIQSDLLKPGGWVESQEVDFFYFFDREGRPFEKDWYWFEVLRDGRIGRKFDMSAGSNVPKYMEEAGFVDIKTYDYVWPCKPWSERPETIPLGEYSAAYMPMVLYFFVAKELVGMGYTENKLTKLRERIREDLMSEEGLHFKFKVSIGRKPFETEREEQGYHERRRPSLR
ncbi:S-adenosyl-L-methionine-dependent methyltransferase [Saccharata proteae CBS 121410]|uniref:S-adenosyl-L-methionine-dependent methyltransferase n=1 Tax=Saccharata proteae CBS 121410 TaxID=1314787 RepID=A0A9P4M0K6_9PEZI|nr:S-adenosyl-L-methionine-dependent methyltransferase [Saccharata proteae CBS 121410]